MAIHNARRRRKVSGVARKIGLQLLRLIRLQPFHVIDAGRLGVRHMLAQTLRLFGVASHDQFADAAVRDTVVRAISVEQMRRAWKQSLPETPAFVIQSGVDDLAVTGRGMFADARFGFQQQDFAPRDCQRARDSEADDARTHYDTVCRLHQRSHRCGSTLPGRRSITVDWPSVKSCRAIKPYHIPAEAALWAAAKKASMPQRS